MSEKKFYKKIDFWLWLCFFLLVVTFVFFKNFQAMDPDLGWHLKSGQLIVENLAVPHDQIFLWTLPQQTWVDHEWLTNLIMFLSYSWGGYSLVSLLSSLVILGTMLLVWFNLKQRGLVNNWLIIIWLSLGLWGSLPHLGIRPQEISFLGLALLYWLLLKYQNHRRLAYLIALVPLMLIWSNAHAGFLIGLVILFVWTIKELWHSYKNRQATKSLWLWPSLAWLVTWLGPYGYKMWSFLFTYRSAEFTNYINEWRSLFSYPFEYYKIVFIGLALSLLIINLINKKRLPWFNYGLIALFLIMSLQAIRHFPLFFITVSFWLLPLVLNNSVTKPSPVWRALTRLSYGLIIAGSIYLIISLGQTSRLDERPFRAHCYHYPCLAVDYIAAQPELYDKRWLNYYGWGGYIIWQLPEMKLFIDGRLPQYPFEDWSMMEEYMQFLDKTKIGATLEKHQINYVLWSAKDEQWQLSRLDRLMYLETRTKKNMANPMLNYLSQSPDWEPIYQDKVAIIYKKKL